MLQFQFVATQVAVLSKECLGMEPEVASGDLEIAKLPKILASDRPHNGLLPAQSAVNSNTQLSLPYFKASKPQPLDR